MIQASSLAVAPPTVRAVVPLRLEHGRVTTWAYPGEGFRAVGGHGTAFFTHPPVPGGEPAAVTFSGIDLSAGGRFRARVQVPDAKAGPVEFVLEVVRSGWVVQRAERRVDRPGDAATWDLGLDPAGGPADVRLFARVADDGHTHHHGNAWWHQPTVSLYEPTPDPDTLPTVTVCVLSHNRRDKLRAVLSAVTRDLAYPADKLDVIVVDNASADGTRDMIRGEFPAVRLVELPTNTGIGGWNEAFSRATGEYLLQLDDDCYLTGDTLAAAVRRMAARPAVGLLSFAPMSPETGLLFTEAYPTGRLSYWGCSAVIRRQALDAVGGFDGRFFFQAFELDLSIRLRAAGWEVEHSPDLVALHMTTVQYEQSPAKFYYSRRNLLVAAMRAFSGTRRLRVLWRLAVVTFIVGKNQTFRHKLKTIAAGLVRGWQWRGAGPAPAAVQELYEANFIEFRPAAEQKASYTSNLFWALRPELYPTLRDCPGVAQLAPATAVRSVERYDGCEWVATSVYPNSLLTHPAPGPATPPATVTIPDVPVAGHRFQVWVFHPHPESEPVVYHVRVTRDGHEVAHEAVTFPPDQRYGVLSIDLAGVSGRCDFEFFSTMRDPGASVACTATHWVRPMLVGGTPAEPEVDAGTVAVVVTYNKLDLLKQSLAALRAQRVRAERVVVVNNASTDGTRAWLEQNADLDVVHLPANVGGAGGFHWGMRVAHQLGARWSWLLDDDTIADPDCLTGLRAAAAAQPHAGFACSLVRWRDGKPCRMNIPQPKWEWLDLHDDRPDLFPVNACSFVSCLVNNATVDIVGYPIKEFFIWYDDFEYTKRLTKLFSGYVALGSEVTHLTPHNRGVDWGEADAKNLWKYRRGAHNEATVTFHGPEGLWRGLGFAAEVWRRTGQAGCALRVRLRLMRAIVAGACWDYRKAIEVPARAATLPLRFSLPRATGTRYPGETWDAVWGDADAFFTAPPHPQSGATPLAAEFAVTVAPGTRFESLVGVVNEKSLPVVFRIDAVRDGQVVWSATELATYADGWRVISRPVEVPPGRYVIRLSSRMWDGAENHHFAWANWVRPRLTRAA